MFIFSRPILCTRCIILMIFIFACVFRSHAQGSIDLNNIRIEEVSEDQLRQLITEIERLKITDTRLEQLAKQQGMTAESFNKLAGRLRLARNNSTSQPNSSGQHRYDTKTTTDSILQQERAPLSDFNFIFNNLIAKNWGASVFNNSVVTFEPNLRLPTPKSYILGADDELLIDVSGYSEASYQLKISPEGSVRIPLVGPIQVSGLTVEQAKRAIVKKMANTIYTNIKSGKTFVEVNLGGIRSIKVNVVGEATLPGTFTLPSLATVYHALYASGGPSVNGSYRDIYLIRNNVRIATIDIYEYLATGTKKNDISLRDQDVIKINTYKTRVELKGEVKKPGIYDVKDNETLADIIEYAGGFTDIAYTARLQVFSNSGKGREVASITGTDINSIVPKRGDTYIIGKILNKFANRISVYGAVYRPGEYQLKEGFTLTKLINEADGLREDAFVNRGIIHRYREDLSPEIISFNISKIINGSEADIVLRKDDRVTIYSKFDLREGRYMTIDGEVQNPGIFLFEEGMKIQDLILMAGGYKEAATQKRIEISRRIKQEDSTSNTRNSLTAIVFQEDTRADLTDSLATPFFELMAFDEVVVRKAPGYTKQNNVLVEGEVVYTGKYSLQSKIERISDLIKRAGGLTPFAYAKGAVLVRTKSLNQTEKYNSAQGLYNLIKQNYQAGTPEILLQNQIAVATQRSSETVDIDLEKIIDFPGTPYDLLLNDGDTLRIPKLLQTVRVNGEVLYPTLVRYDGGYSFKEYINKAGGFNERSARKRAYVVHPNGSAKGTKSFFFIKNYAHIQPGSEIFVPIKRERERLRTFEVVSLTTALATLAVILFNVTR